MKDPREVIIRPVITEHSYDMMNKNTYTFEVAKDSNKVEIRQAIEAIFNVTVTKVNTLNVKSKPKRVRYAAGSHPHLEEGHGYAERRRHHRALQRVSSFLNRPLGFSTKRAQHA